MKKQPTIIDDIAADTDWVRLPDGRVTTVGELRERYEMAEEIRKLKRKRTELKRERTELESKRNYLLGVCFVLFAGRDSESNDQLKKPIARGADDDLHKLGAELSLKLELLRERHGLPSSLLGEHGWRELALALAMKHEPGFKMQRPRGRDRLDIRERAMLILDVQNVMAEHGNNNVSAAARILVTTSKYAKRWKGRSKGRLENLYGTEIKNEETIKLIASLRETAREMEWPDLWEMLNRRYQFAKESRK